MAKIGLKYMAWSRIKEEPATGAVVYEKGKVLGKAIATNLVVSNAEGELYGDDALAEYVAEFSSADFTADVDNMELADQAELYGATFDEERGLQHYGSDNAPYGGIGGYQSLMVHGVRKYRVWFLAKVKAAIPDETGATKAGSISFGTQPIKMKAMEPNHGPWKIVKEFSTETAAQAFVDMLLNVAVWHSVQVQAQGETSLAFARPQGVFAVAAGEDFTLDIAGDPMALYDNGEDQLLAVEEGKYKVAGVAENHRIAVIF